LGDLVLFKEQLISNSYERMGLKEGRPKMKNTATIGGVP